MAGHHHHAASAYSHAHAVNDERRVGLATIDTSLFMVVEVAGDLFSGSLALLADAGHMASDTAGFALAWFAFRIARRRADSQRNCGFDRFQILIAFVNGAMLLIIAVWLVIEAATRTFEPTEVLGTPILVALIIIRSAWALIKASTHILLEGTPDGIDTHEIRADLEAEIAAVSDIHHVHAWSINNTRPMVTQHARTDETGAPDTVTAAIKARLLEKFGIAHATVEIEHETCADNASHRRGDATTMADGQGSAQLSRPQLRPDPPGSAPRTARPPERSDCSSQPAHPVRGGPGVPALARSGPAVPRSRGAGRRPGNDPRSRAARTCRKTDPGAGGPDHGRDRAGQAPCPSGGRVRPARSARISAWRARSRQGADRHDRLSGCGRRTGQFLVFAARADRCASGDLLDRLIAAYAPDRSTIGRREAKRCRWRV